jgi:hypothetical protein
MYGGIGAVHNWKEKYGCGTQNRQEGELKTEISGEYQSTVPKLRCWYKGPDC